MLHTNSSLSCCKLGASHLAAKSYSGDILHPITSLNWILLAPLLTAMFYSGAMPHANTSLNSFVGASHLDATFHSDAMYHTNFIIY
jgi:hypothetical protein